MRSSFEELVTGYSAVKMDHNSDKWFESYSFLNFSCTEINARYVIAGYIYIDEMVG